jgi:hypothetical protein
MPACTRHTKHTSTPAQITTRTRRKLEPKQNQQPTNTRNKPELWPPLRTAQRSTNQPRKPTLPEYVTSSHRNMTHSRPTSPYTMTPLVSRTARQRSSKVVLYDFSSSQKQQPQQPRRDDNVRHDFRHSDVDPPTAISLSSYGYTLKARESARRKALMDAIYQEGINKVQSRLWYLSQKHENDALTRQVLADDHDWVEMYHTRAVTRHKIEHDRERSRERLLKRLQRKSQHRL